MDQSSLFTTSSSGHAQNASQFSQYREISSRLKSKTRALIPSKKINLNDVSDQFTSLGRELAPFDKSYEAFCHLAAAKTQRLIPHAVNNEFQHLMQAARSFRDAAMQTDGSFDEENREEINNAISCYRHAVKLCHQSQLSVLHHELGSLYDKIGSYDEAGRCFMDAASYRKAGSAFTRSGDYFSAVGAYESIRDADKSNDDLIMSFLLKLSANQIHVLKLIEPNGGQGSGPASEKRSDMRRVSSINIQDTHVAIRFPVIPLVADSRSSIADKKDRMVKPEEELLLMKPDVLSLNITLESLYYFLRDHKNVNSVSERVINPLSSTSDEEDEDDNRKSDGEENDDEDSVEYRNEEKLMRMRLLNELFTRIRDPCQRKLIHDLLVE